MSPPLLLRAALLALCACAAHSAVVSSTYSLIDTSVSNFPFLPSVRLSVALYTTTFDAPAYFVPGGCKQGPLCNQTNFGTCCSACDGITPLVSPLNRPGCVCPSFPNSYCIDATAPFPAPDWFYRQPISETILFFEIPVLRSCNNFIVDLDVVEGEADVNFFPDTAYRDPTSNRIGWSRMRGNDIIAVNDLASVIGGTPSDGVPRIYGAIQGGGRMTISITEMTTANQLLPLVGPQGQQYYAARTASGKCAGVPFAGVHFPPPFFPLIMPSTADPWWDFALSLGHLRPLNKSAVLPNVYTVAITLSSDVYDDPSGIIAADISTCTLDLSWLLDATGAPLAPASGVNWTEAYDTCDFNALQARATELSALQTQRAQSVLNFLQPAVTAIWSAGAVTGTRAYAACKAFASDKFVNTSLTATETSTDCYAAPGSPDFANDPCCNSALLYFQCCVPRSVRVQSATPNSAQVQALCSNPECSQGSADIYAIAAQRQSEKVCGREALDALLTTVFPIGGNAGLPGGPCAVLLSSTPAKDAALINCLSDNLAVSLRAEFLNLWGLDSSLVTTANFTALLEQQYTLQSGCIQAGAPPLDTTNQKFYNPRNMALDADPTACASAQSCNWDFFRTDPQSCNDGGYRGNMMCADCSYGFCKEVSVFPVCYNSFAYALGVPKRTLCNETGGVYTGYDTSVLCYYPAVTTQAACMNPAFCNPSALSCSPYCYGTGIAQSECSCATLSPSHPLYGNCSLLTWNGFQCAVTGISTRNACATFPGSSFWIGAQWQNGNAFASQAGCGLGMCADKPGLNQTECAALTVGSCSRNCPGCNQTVCESAPGCNDTLFNGGACVSGYVGRGANYVFCVSGGNPVPGLGCVFNSQNSASIAASCAAFGVYKPAYLVSGPSANSSQCESYSYCAETGALAITTPKNASYCTSCGGTVVPAFRWGPGVWTPRAPQWKPLQWVQRSYSANYQVGKMFNQTGFALDFFYRIFPAQQARISNQNYQCQFSQANSALTNLACDCVNGGENRQCYTSAQLELLSLERACLGLDNTFEILPYVVYAIPPTASFSPSCVDIELSLLRANLYRRQSDNVYSSVFLQSVSPNLYTVIKNTHKVLVGQLAGDGARIAVNGAITGNVTVCLALSDSISVSSVYTVLDFASVDDDLSTSSITPMNVDVYVVNDTLCGTIPADTLTTLLPIYRVKNWESAKLFNLLTTTQKNCFWAAVFFFGAVWLLLLYRLVNVIMFAVIVPRRSKAKNLLLIAAIIGLLFVAFTLRWVYFLVTPLGGLIGRPKIADIILAELPFYLWLSTFTVVVSWWIELYHWASREKKGFLSNVYLILIGVNVVLYLFFIAVIAAYAAKSGDTINFDSLCGGSRAKSERGLKILSRVYKTTVSVIAAVLAIAFIAYGTSLVRVLSSGNKVNTRSVGQFTAVAVTCAVALILQCALLLYTTYAKSINTVAALVIIIIVEVLPGLVLAYSVRQPRVMSGWRDTVWCCFSPEAYSAPSSSTANTATGSRGASAAPSRHPGSIGSAASAVSATSP